MFIVPFSELWASTAWHPANEQLRLLGREPDDPEHYLVRELIRNVLHAAGAVEYTVGKLEAALDADEAWISEFAPEERFERRHPVGIVGPNRDAALYEYGNLLLWLKALQERIRRKIPPYNEERHWGLLPALAPGQFWTVRIGDAYSALCVETLGDRSLANFVTHSGAVPPAYGSSELVDGRLVLPIPDTPRRHVHLSDELTYELNRDARALGRTALKAVEAFVESMISALEDANREILERRAASQSEVLADQPI